MSESSAGKRNQGKGPELRKLSEREQEKLKARQQKYLNALEDLAILRDHYKRELQKRLEMKVRKQRWNIKKRKEFDKAKEANKEETSEPQPTRSRSEFVDKKDDLSFLRGVKVTRVHRITKIESILEKEGQIKYRGDRDELWNILIVPENLRIIEEEMSKGSTLTLRKIRQILKERNGLLETQMLTSEEEPDRVDVISLPGKSKGRYRMKSTSERPMDKIEKILPKVQPPKFQILFSGTLGKEENTLEGSSSQVFEKKKEERLRKQRKVNEMYEHSVAYKAATERLLKKFSMGPYDPGRNMLTFSMPGKVALSAKQEDTQERVREEAQGAANSLRADQDRFSRTLTEDLGSGETMRSEFLPKIQSPSAEIRMAKVLSLQALEEHSVVLVAKGMSQMWINPKK